MEVVLNRNGWHNRLQTWTFGQPSTLANLCPYFWLTMLCLLMSPLVCVWKVVKWVALGIGSLLGMGYRERAADEWEAWRKKRDRRDRLMSKLGAVAKYICMGILGVIVLGSVGFVVWVFIQEPIMMLYLLGVIAGSAAFIGAVMGLYWLLTKLRIMPDFDGKHTSLVGYAWGGVCAFFGFIGKYALAAYQGVCPHIEWE